MPFSILNLVEGFRTCMFLLDFQKAFDTSDHKIRKISWPHGIHKFCLKQWSIGSSHSSQKSFHVSLCSIPLEVGTIN